MQTDTNMLMTIYTPADNKHEDGLKTRLETLWPKYYKK